MVFISEINKHNFTFERALDFVQQLFHGLLLHLQFYFNTEMIITHTQRKLKMTVYLNESLSITILVFQFQFFYNLLFN
jgi:hypothetical protein